MSGVPFPPVRPEDHGTMGDDGEVRVCLNLHVPKPTPRVKLTGDPKFLARLEEFVAKLQSMIDEHQKSQGQFYPGTKITVENGIKNVRIVRNGTDGNTSRSVWGFVEKETGNILKAAGWKAPAKHARGNIHDADMMKGCTIWGPEYLR